MRAPHPPALRLQDEEARGSQQSSEQEEEGPDDEVTSPPRPTAARGSKGGKQPVAAPAAAQRPQRRRSSRQHAVPAAAAEPEAAGAARSKRPPRRTAKQPQLAAEASDEDMEDSGSEGEAPQPGPTSRLAELARREKEPVQSRLRNGAKGRRAQQAQPEAAPAGGSEEEDEEEQQRGRKRRASYSRQQKQREQQPAGSKGAGKRKQPVALGPAAEDTAMAAAEEPAEALKAAKRPRRGAQPEAMQQSEQQPEQQQQPQVEEDEPRQQRQRQQLPKQSQQGRQRSTRSKQPRQQAVPQAAPSPAAEQQAQQAQRRGAPSPTPAAAAEGQQLEMSVPPEAAPGEAAQQEQGQGAAAEWRPADPGNPAAAASDLLLRRLQHPRSKEASTMPLRPRAQVRGEATCAGRGAARAGRAGDTNAWLPSWLPPPPTLAPTSAGGVRGAGGQPVQHGGAGAQQLPAAHRAARLRQDAGAGRRGGQWGGRSTRSRRGRCWVVRGGRCGQRRRLMQNLLHCLLHCTVLRCTACAVPGGGARAGGAAGPLQHRPPGPGGEAAVASRPWFSDALTSCRACCRGARW